MKKEKFTHRKEDSCPLLSKYLRTIHSQGPPRAPAYMAQLQAQRASEAMVPESSDPSSCATLPSELGQFSYSGKNSSMLG